MIINNYARWLLLLLLSPWVCADDDKPVDAFNKEYRAYQAAINADNFRVALPHAEKALRLGLEVYGEDTKNVAALSYNYGLNLMDVGEFDAARTELDRTVDRYKKVYGADNEALVSVYMDAGHADAKELDINGAVWNFRAALNIVEKLYQKQSLEYGRISFEVGRLLLDEARASNAERYLEDALEIMEEKQGKDDVNTAMANFYLGKFHLANKKYSRSEPYFASAVTVLAEGGEQFRQVVLVARGFLVETYENLEETAKATEQLRAIALAVPQQGTEDYQPVYRVAPEYPANAAEIRREGHVVVEFTVTKEGKVIEPQIVDREGHAAFEAAAMEAVTQWRYAPRFVDGKAVDTEGVRTMLTFKMTN